MCYTSGTTGNAKGVKLTHNNVLHDVESLTEKLFDID
jgi:long-subunit acyl-CoA synthetase (AMP-forming)